MGKTTSLNYAWLYAGCFFGAGFVSGNEMLSFFGKFGIVGFLLFASSLAVSAITAYRLSVLNNSVYQGKTNSVVFGTKNKFLLKISTFAKCFFMFCLVTFCTSCAGELFNYAADVNKICGAVLFSIICALISVTGKKGTLTVFSLCVPAISLFCVFYSFVYTCRTKEIFIPQSGFALAELYTPFLYASYNIFAGAGTLVSAEPCDKQSLKKGLLTGSLILFLCGSAVMWLTVISPHTNNNLPMVDIIYSRSNVLGCVFSALLLLSLISTAVSRIFMLVNTLFKKASIKKNVCPAICIFAFTASLAGLDNIIGFIYPVFGIMGAFTVLSVNLSYRMKFSFLGKKQSYAFCRRSKA